MDQLDAADGRRPSYGKVVLVHFCTYTCINWLRTLPYVRAWAEYKQGLVVIGVHTPEFEFEHDVDHVRRAMRSKCGIEFPIVIDNDYSIWRAFRNQYWPALYLLERAGAFAHHHFGEGEYQEIGFVGASIACRCRRASRDGFVVGHRHGGRRPAAGLVILIS